MFVNRDGFLNVRLDAALTGQLHIRDDSGRPPTAEPVADVPHLNSSPSLSFPQKRGIVTMNRLAHSPSVTRRRTRQPITPCRRFVLGKRKTVAACRRATGKSGDGQCLPCHWPLRRGWEVPSLSSSMPERKSLWCKSREEADALKAHDRTHDRRSWVAHRRRSARRVPLNTCASRCPPATTANLSYQAWALPPARSVAQRHHSRGRRQAVPR